MAIFKTEDERDIETLEKLEKKIARRQKRNRLTRIIMAGVGALALSFVAGHICGRHCAMKDTLHKGL
ncbi:MAG: hypothetical protein K1V84_07265 [Muribaculaceae bacterium]